MTPRTLGSLGDAAYDFALTALVVAVFTMLFLQAVYGLGLRGWFQRRLFLSWLWRRIETESKDRRRTLWGLIKLWAWRARPPEVEDAEAQLLRLTGAPSPGALFSLTHAQLCGQIAAALQAELDAPGEKPLARVFAQGVDPFDLMVAEKEKESEAAFRVRFQAERGLDALQTSLARGTQIAEYVAALAITLALAAVLLPRPGADEEFGRVRSLYAAVAIAAALLVPVIRVLLERATIARQA